MNDDWKIFFLGAKTIDVISLSSKGKADIFNVYLIVSFHSHFFCLFKVHE